MISLIEREMVDKYKWIKRDEFLDLLSLSQSLPGVMAVNIAVSVGDKLRGLRGCVVAAAGTILPSFLIILAIAVYLTPDTINNNRFVNAVFTGIRPCVVALIIAPVITSARSANMGWRTVWIPIAVAVSIAVGLSPILFIVIGGFAGWWWLARHESKRRLNN
jgi:chromate transporter